MPKSKINYPEIPNPINWKPAGWHESWDRKFKVRVVPSQIVLVPGGRELLRPFCRSMSSMVSQRC